MELPPQIKPYVERVDAVMAKYPSATQYGRYSFFCLGRFAAAESFFFRVRSAVCARTVAFYGRNSRFRPTLRKLQHYDNASMIPIHTCKTYGMIQPK